MQLAYMWGIRTPSTFHIFGIEHMLKVAVQLQSQMLQHAEETYQLPVKILLSSLHC